MVIQKPENTLLLIKIYEFIKASGVFEHESELEWICRLNQLYTKGWLFTSSTDDELMAVAAGYRIAEWREEYRYHLPQAEEGNILYVPFFMSRFRRQSDLLKILHQYLSENEGIEQIIFYRKLGFANAKKRELPRTYSIQPQSLSYALKRLEYRHKVGVLPPAFDPVC